MIRLDLFNMRSSVNFQDLAPDDQAYLRGLGLVAEEIVESTQYTYEPMGVSNPERKANGKPPFLHRTFVTREIIKDVIVTAPELRNQYASIEFLFSVEIYAYRYVNSYAKLAKLGCKFYVWNGKDIISYNPLADLLCFEIFYLLHASTPVDQKTLFNLAADKKISSDHLLIADDKFNAELIETYDHKGYNYVLEPTLATIIANQFASDIHFLAIKSKFDYKMLPPNLNLKESELPRFENLYNLEVTHTLLDDVTTLMNQSPQLTALTLMQCLSDKFNHKSIYPKEDLATLRLYECRVSAEYIIHLLEMCPNVKHIVLSRVEIINWNASSRFPSLRLLKLLTIFDSSHEFLSLITPNVEVLTLIYNEKKLRVNPSVKQLSGVKSAYIGMRDVNKEIFATSILNNLPVDLHTVRIGSNCFTYDEIINFINRYDDLKRVMLELINSPKKNEILIKYPQAILIDVPIRNVLPQSTPPLVTPISRQKVTADARLDVSELSLDANTEEGAVTYHVPILFKTNSPELNIPSLYRLRVYNRLSEDIVPYATYHWQEYKDYKIIEKLEAKYEKEAKRKPHNLAYSVIDLVPNSKVYQILFSLSGNEKITHIEINDPKARFTLFQDVDTKYCRGTRLYAAKVEAKQTVQLKYILEVNRILYHRDFLIDTQVKKNINYFASFKPGKLNQKGYFDDALSYLGLSSSEEVKEEKLSRPELLKKIKQNKVGYCRHQSLAGFHTFLQEAPTTKYDPLLVKNIPHAFVELFQPDGKIVTVDFSFGAQNRGENKSEAEDKHVLIPFEEHPSVKSVITIESPEIKNELTKEELAELAKYSKPKLTLPTEKVEEFFPALVKTSNKPIMLTLSDAECCQGFRNAAATYFHNNEIQYCCVDDLDDFKTTETKSFLEKIQESEKEAILFVYWNTNKKNKSQFVGLNSLFDTPPTLNGKKLPENLKIIAFKQEKTVLMEDVRSRFQKRIIPVSTTLVLPSAHEAIQQSIAQKDEKPSHSINLYESFEWEKYLLGEYENGKSRFVDGKLLQLIQLASQNSEKKYELRVDNLPWKLPEFNVFWNRLCIEKRVFVNNRYYYLPKNLSITWAEFPFELPKNIKFRALDEKNAHEWKNALNQETVNRCYSYSVSNSEGVVESKEGYISQQKDKAFTALVSETLMLRQYEQLSAMAEERKCLLDIIVGPGVRLPCEFKLDLIKASPFKPKEGPVSLITTNDPDYVEGLSPSDVVFTVGKDTNYSLVDHWVDAKCAGNSDESGYINEEGILLRALKEGKSVTLKGTFSESLLKRLQTIFADPPFLEHNGEFLEFGIDKPLKGKLRIITEKNPFPFIEPEKITLSHDDYFNLFHDDAKIRLLKTLCKELNINVQYYSQIQSMLANLANHPEKNPVEWLWLLSDKPEENVIKGLQLYNKLTNYQFEVKKDKEEKKLDELELRINEITTRLDSLPYLFMIGPSGTGKSTAVLHELKKYYQARKKAVRMFSAIPPVIDNIEKWASAQDEKIKILFIDEANLAEEEYYAFVDGMSKKPPSIVYRGDEIKLTENHKIIFAGNYQYYQKRRKHSLFFKNDCVFHYPRFSEEFIQNKMLLPLIELAFGDDESKVNNAKEVLAIFTGATLLTKAIMPTINLTERNIQAMTLAFINLWNNKSLFSEKSLTVRIDLLSKWAFYQNARDLLGDKARLLQSDLFGTEAEYKALKVKFLRQKREHLLDFYVTSIHKRSAAVLKEEMQIRDLRFNLQTSMEISVGTRGTLSEGIPGVGKSSIAINLLKKLGFEQAVFGSTPEEIKSDKAPKIFYHITANDPEIMQKMLIDAFHQGAVVIIDELNALPLEGLLNALLMGYDPDGDPARREGFYVIGTQNPISLGGRSALSTALENRFRKLEMKDFTLNDVKNFLAEKFQEIPEHIRTLFARKYIEERNKGQDYNFRDLLSDVKDAREIVRDQKSVQQLTTKHIPTGEFKMTCSSQQKTLGFQ